MSLVVHTAIYGGYDLPKPVPQINGVDRWVLHTDDPNLDAPGWEVIHDPEPLGRPVHPRIAAKWHKCHPPAGAASIWVDGSATMLAADQSGDGRTFVDVVMDQFGQGKHWALFPHPERTEIGDEATISHLVLPAKYPASLDLQGQVARYEGWPRTRLYASTVFGRVHTRQVLQAGAAWFAHNDLLTYQDQLSLPIVLAQYKIKVGEFTGGALFANPWLRYTYHTRED